MVRVVQAVRSIVEAALRPLDGLAPWASLAIVGAVTGLVMLIVIRWTSPQRLIERARAQMAGAVLEMRLYLDEPRRVFAAQGRLIVWTVIYVGSLLPSMLALALPLGALFCQLEIRHGIAPLQAPTTVVMEVDLAADTQVRDVSIVPMGPVAVTARVRDEQAHAVYARLAIRAPGRHHVAVHIGGTEVIKEISADPAADVVSPARARGLAYLWTATAEAPLAGPVRAIRLPHSDRAGDLPVRWWLYWLGCASVVALLLRRRFDVVF